MSIQGPARRVAGRCLFCQTLPYRPLLQQTQQRAFSAGQCKRAAEDDNTSRPNPVLEQWKRDNAEQKAGDQGPVVRGASQAGDISASSIFEDDRRAQEQVAQLSSEGQDGGPEAGSRNRNPENSLRVLDPDPNGRERWERKKVIQMIRKGGRLSAQQVIKRTEREHTVRSHNIKTSVKKLGMLARQIAGKTIDDAITQMRFSKKKVAQDVLKQLEYARDEAIVMRGMGLSQAQKTADGEPPESLLPSSAGNGTVGPVEIQLKDGKRHKVTDPTTIYIDQAWVGRGPFGQLPDFRARGQVNIMRTPWTSLSVILKEEKTRVREYEEREAKRREKVVGKGMWTHLPDRPVQWQRQWYTF